MTGDALPVDAVVGRGAGLHGRGRRCGGGNLPRPMGRDKERGFSICDEFNLSYFPEGSV
jgi:hypothetical protein